MNKLTQEQATALLAQPLENIKEFIKSHTDKPSVPRWVRCPTEIPETLEFLETSYHGIDRHLRWHFTPQGNDYWSSLRIELGRLKDELKASM